MAARDALPRLPGITDVVPTYRSLTVHFDPRQLAPEELSRHLLAAADAPQKSALAGRRWRIPVCYGGEHGPDLAAVATATGRAPEEVVAALCGQPWRVFLIGFLPGFPYMGELPEWLRLPRLGTPRTAVSERSVAIAAAQCAIYPWQSPGGWHLLGRTPARLFDAADSEQPALLAPGDAVSFVAIDGSEYDRLEAAIAGGELSSRNFSV
jgi:KipI family sensor histidine kinase inhibitor